MGWVSQGASDPPFTLANEAQARGVSFLEKNFATAMKYPFETLGGAVAALDYDRGRGTSSFSPTSGPETPPRAGSTRRSTTG
jgi:hypothetical protein